MDKDSNIYFQGAIIDSKAPAEKNKLTTGTLTWEKHRQQSRIQNKSKRNYRIH